MESNQELPSPPSGAMRSPAERRELEHHAELLELGTHLAFLRPRAQMAATYFSFETEISTGDPYPSSEQATSGSEVEGTTNFGPRVSPLRSMQLQTVKDPPLTPKGGLLTPKGRYLQPGATIDSDTVAALQQRIRDLSSGPGTPTSTPTTSMLLQGHRAVNIRDFKETIRDKLCVTEGIISKDMIRKQPLLILEFHDLTYTVKQKNDLPQSKAHEEVVPVLDRISSHESASLMLRHSVHVAAQSPMQQPAAPGSSRMSLLDQISGEARDGEILAVMGPSGSGKSTLIDALAQRIVPESLAGNITLNGEQVSNSLLRSISAYVMQDDLLFPMLTVQETLMFAAEVRLPNSSHSTDRKKERVNQLLHQLGLHSVANTIIGDEGHRGVSGGERRRVSIGIDIIHDPLLLFLDEPTSGLDSTSAYLVIRTLQKIAQTGSIVILSIHQPSYRILGLLDRLIILAFGQKIYGGSPAGLNSFYEAFGRPVPEHENSTEHALDLIQELHTSVTGIKPLVQFSKTWKGHDSDGDSGLKALVGTVDVKGAITASIARGKLVATRGYNDQEMGCDYGVSEFGRLSDSASMVVKFANPWWREVPVLIWRSLINISRTPELFLMRLGTVVVTGFLLATVFWGLDDSPKGVQERLGFFAFAMSTTFYTCADALPVFLQERYIFMRETAHNAYRKSSYVLAHAVIYVPFLAILSIAFSVTIWWAVGLAGGSSGFGFFFLIVWASFWTGNSFVTLLSALLPNVMLGYTIVVAILAYFLLLSGFFISRDRIPKYWLWFHYLSIIKYPYEAVLINEFDRAGSCYELGSDILYGTPLAAIPDPALLNGILGFLRTALKGTAYETLNGNTCITTGHDILESRDINQLSKWALLAITFSFGVFFRLLFYIVLRCSGKNRRR
ncbi:unnamed protein product [Calypogeia fissa]